MWVVVVTTSAFCSHATSEGEQTTQWQPVSWVCYGLTDKAWCGEEGLVHPEHPLKTGERGVGGENGLQGIIIKGIDWVWLFENLWIGGAI